MSDSTSEIQAEAATTAARVCDYLIWAARERGEALTNLKLQKLLYYAQAWYLSLHARPLFDEDFQAWANGPVLPSQYQRFRAFTWQPIAAPIEVPELPKDLQLFLDEILDVFGVESAIALEQMTHRERPWREALGNLPPDQSAQTKISKRAMLQFYRSMKGDQVR